MTNLDAVIALAKNEQWGKVDKQVPKLARKNVVLSKAVDLLGHKDANVRDLGATLLQRARTIPKGLVPEAYDHLYRVMATHNGYDAFRAACALAKHKPEYEPERIRQALLRFTKDKDVGHIARGYLRFV